MASDYSIGFTGSTLDEIMPWIDDQVGDTSKVVVAMAGSGKDIAHLARYGRTIVSFDTQEISRCVVDGMFRAAPAPKSPPLTLGTLEGYATSTEGLGDMPADAAGAADYIAVAGDDYDRVCLFYALVRCSLMGRGQVWGRDKTVVDLERLYRRAHERLQAWRSLPGTFEHHKGSVFDADPSVFDDAVLFVDTPKVVQGNRDIYSSGYVRLNSIIAQAPVELPRWSEDTFWRDMPHLWNAPYDRMVLFHVTGARPEPRAVFDRMLEDGVPRPSTIGSWKHKGRTDVAWVVDRS